MIFLLKNNLECNKICGAISKLIKSEIKTQKDLENYALCITLSKITDSEEKQQEAKFLEQKV
jgi:hypothetical protein